MKTLLGILVIVLADSAGDVLLTRGMRQVGEIATFAPKELILVARRALGNRHVLASLLCMTVHFVGFLLLLSWADLSLVFPATALVYVVTTLAAKFILRETVNGYRWTGVMLVCVGVALVSVP
ncbi:EamA family transporter [Nitrospira sp. Kam-Ns4a]